MRNRVFLASSILLFSLNGYAQTDSPPACQCATPESEAYTYNIPDIETIEYTQLSGEGELGAAVTSGNTNTENIIAVLNIMYRTYKWKHTGTYDTQKATDSNIVTVERSTVKLKTNYKYSEKRYAFLATRYEDDQFSGFDFQRSLSAGHGWHLIDHDTTQFDLELGAGYKESRTDLDEAIDENIFRGYGLYSHQLGENTHFIEEILLESSDENTHSESTTGLKVSINGSLALKVTLNIKRNSNPQPDRPATDRSSSITLVYGF